MRIESIKTDSNGFKLLAASYVFNFPACKPQVSPCTFFDYKDGVLREFRGNTSFSMNVPTFRGALKLILYKK